MSDTLSSYKKAKIEWELSLRTDLESFYGNKREAQNHEFAFCVEIPWPLLNIWGKLLEESECKKEINVIDLFNLTVKGGWYAIKRDTLRIKELLRKNISRVRIIFKKTKGSKRYNELENKVYIMNVRREEVESIDELKEDVEMYEQEIKQWREQYVDLEAEKRRMYEEMKRELDNREEEIKELDEISVELSKYIEALEKGNEMLKCQGKQIHEVGSKQKTRKLKLLKHKAQCALWFSKTFGLEVESITFKDGDNNQYNVEYTDSERGYSKLSEADRSKLEQVLFLLDKFCVGDEVFHELSISSNGSLPKSYLIKQLRSDLNKTYHIERTPGKYCGAQLDFTSTLTSHIRELLNSKPELKDHAIDIKLSGDGARMSRTTNFMMFSFTLLQNNESVMSSKSNRTVAIVNGPEKYCTMKESLSTFFEEINALKEKGTLLVDDKEIKLNFFLGDLKFLLLIMGMNAACSNYACLWCKIHKQNRWDTSKPSDFYQGEELIRTLKDLKELCNLKKDNFGCVNEPLLNIELTNVVPDELHLLLRVTDVLLKNVIDEAVEHDAIGDFQKNRGQRKGIHLDKVVKSINDIGISFSIWNKKNADGSESNLKEFTSLLGSQKKKLIHEFPSKLHLFLYPDTCNTVEKIWTDFAQLYDMISDFNLTKDACTELFSKGKAWIELYCSLRGVRPGYSRQKVTPYMHLIPYHIPHFVKLHGCVKKFTGQGVEKNNADAKTILFQKSNKWDGAVDILCTESRQWDLRHHEREKNKYVKRKLEYWEHDISVKRKGRQVIPQESMLDEETFDENKIDYNEYTMKQLKQMIIEKNLSRKGISKLKKKELITLLENS